MGTVETTAGDAVEDLSVSLTGMSDYQTDSHKPKDTDDDGEVAFATLQDGMYDVEAISNDEYTVSPANSVQEVAVYHDEAQWVKWLEDQEEDEDDRTVDDDGSDGETATWTVSRQGGVIMGYVGNDANGDKRMRGKEAVEGITVEVTSGTGSKKKTYTDETDDKGFYVFTELPELASGSYTVTVKPEAGCCRAVIRTTDDDDDVVEANSAKVTNAQLGTADDAALPADNEGDFSLPAISTTNREMNSTATGVTSNTVGTGTSKKTFTTVNFALLYMNGTASGVVDNLDKSANSSNGIDVRVYACKTGTEDSCDRGDLVTDDAEETVGNGDYSVSGLEEGWYEAVIEDANWESPLLDADGDADDDASCEDPDNAGSFGAEFCDTAPMSAFLMLDGPADAGAFDDLVVYSADDEMTDDALVDAGDVEVTVKVHSATAAEYARDSTAATGWARDNTASPNSTGSAIGGAGFDNWLTVAYGSDITFEFAKAEDADYEISARSLDDDDQTCSGDKCAGLGAVVGAKTDAAPFGNANGEAVLDTIDVWVTAANGYNDHVYSIIVTEQGPVGTILRSATSSHGIRILTRRRRLRPATARSVAPSLRIRLTWLSNWKCSVVSRPGT